MQACPRMERRFAKRGMIKLAPEIILIQMQPQPRSATTDGILAVLSVPSLFSTDCDVRSQVVNSPKA